MSCLRWFPWRQGSPCFRAHKAVSCFSDSQRRKAGHLPLPCHLDTALVAPYCPGRRALSFGFCGKTVFALLAKIIHKLFNLTENREFVCRYKLNCFRRICISAATSKIISVPAVKLYALYMILSSIFLEGEQIFFPQAPVFSIKKS